MFQSALPLEDRRVLKNQQRSTWLFIALLIMSVAVLLFYNTFVPVQKTFTVKQPTYNQYLDLFSKYSNKLQCQCKTVSIAYDRFVQLNYTLHYICSSFLVSQQWIEYLTGADLIRLIVYDFRLRGRFSSGALRSFCQLTNETIQNSLASFYKTQYVSAYLATSDLFRQQSEGQIQQFISSTTKTFLFGLQLIMNTVQGNTLYSGAAPNYNFHSTAVPGFGMPNPISYSNCSCAMSVSCFQDESIMYNIFGNASFFIVPGLLRGCYITESLLASSLECFHDQQCFNNLTYHLNSTYNMSFTVLDASLSTKFTAYSTVREMLDELMVEQWTWNITFENYYDGCEPTECTYTVEGRNEALFIVTTAIGLIGGLVKILKLTVPRIVALFACLIVMINGRI